MLHNTRLKRLIIDKQSSLLSLFVSYEENVVLDMAPGIKLSPFYFLSNYQMGPISKGYAEKASHGQTI